MPPFYDVAPVGQDDIPQESPMSLSGLLEPFSDNIIEPFNRSVIFARWFSDEK